MAYVEIPKDLSKIQTKVALGLTKKQIIGFAVAAVIGIPVFLTTRVSVGNDLGLILMMAAMSLPILYAVYEPKGMTIEQYIAAWLRFQFVARGIRPYRTDNFFEQFIGGRKENPNIYEQGKNPIRKEAGRKKTGTAKVPATTK